MEKVINEGNNWDQMTNTDEMLGPIQSLTRLELMNAVKTMILGRRTPGLSEVNKEMRAASGKVGVEVMIRLCQRILNEKGIPDE